MSSPNYFVVVRELATRGVLLRVQWLMSGKPAHEYGKNVALQILLEPYREFIEGPGANRLSARQREYVQSALRLGNLLELPDSPELQSKMNDPRPGYYGARRFMGTGRASGVKLLLFGPDYAKFCDEADCAIYFLNVSASSDDGFAEYTVFCMSRSATPAGGAEPWRPGGSTAPIGVTRSP